MTPVQTVANNLPPTINRIANDLCVEEEYVSDLLDKLSVDSTKHYIPLVRVLDRIEDDFPDLDSGDEIEVLRQSVQQEIESSVLSEQEKKQKTKFEGMVSRGSRQEAEGLRGLRTGRLYREEYPTWNDYCLAVFRITGTTADNRIAWLRMTELIEAKLGKDHVLGVVEAKELLRLDDFPELAAESLLAAEEKAEQAGRKRQTDDVAAEVKRRMDYRSHADEMSLEEFEAIRDAGISTWSADDVVRKVREHQADGLAFADALELVDEVKDARKKKQIYEKRNDLNTVNTKIKEMTESSDLKANRDEAKRLKKELKAMEDGKEAPDDSSEDGDEEMTSEIFDLLTNADQALEEARDSSSWIDPTLTQAELNAILDKAEEVEKSLADVVAKAKEELANAGKEEEPENVSRLD